MALGYVLYRALPEGDPTLTSPRDVGLFLMGAGAAFGSSAGNLALGVPDDVIVGVAIRSAGLAAGGALLLVGLVACSPGLGDSPCGSSGDGLFVATSALVSAGLVGGVVYDLATIPGNARDARRRAVGGGVGLGPGSAPTATLRVGL